MYISPYFETKDTPILSDGLQSTSVTVFSYVLYLVKKSNSNKRITSTFTTSTGSLTTRYILYCLLMIIIDSYRSSPNIDLSLFSFACEVETYKQQ